MHLVQRVVRRPHALARFDAINELFRERGQVAGVEPFAASAI